MDGGVVPIRKIKDFLCLFESIFIIYLPSITESFSDWHKPTDSGFWSPFSEKFLSKDANLHFVQIHILCSIVYHLLEEFPTNNWANFLKYKIFFDELKIKVTFFSFRHSKSPNGIQKNSSLHKEIQILPVRCIGDPSTPTDQCAVFYVIEIYIFKS